MSASHRRDCFGIQRIRTLADDGTGKRLEGTSRIQVTAIAIGQPPNCLLSSTLCRGSTCHCHLLAAVHPSWTDVNYAW